MNQASPRHPINEAAVIRASGLASLQMPHAADIGTSVKAIDGRYQLVNKAMASLLGKAMEQIGGMTDADLFPIGIAVQLQRSDQQIANGAALACDDLTLSVNGVATRCLWIKFPVFSSDGKVVSIGAVTINMAAQQEAAEMRQSLERLQQSNQELQKTVAELRHLAGIDKLTGSWNRRRLEQTAVHEMERLKQYDHPLSLMVIDIDFFKKVTDRHGNPAGDQVLAKLAAMIQSTVRSTDSLTRWSNEEFVVLCPDTTLSTITMLAERLRETVAQAVFPSVNHLTVCVGIAECMRGETWEQWFKRADLALCRAKACGGDQVQFAPETPRHVGVGENALTNLVQLSWHTAYECGNPVIDEQHRALFGHANKLLAAVLDAQPKDEVAALIEAVVDAIVEHFNDEEMIITAAGFPREAAHAAIHRELVDSVLRQVSGFHAGTLAIGELFQFLSHNVVARHMLGADREFFPYLATSR